MMDTAFLWKIRQTVEKNFKRKKNKDLYAIRDVK